MHIEIDNESIKWIEAKGNALTVKEIDVKTCCTPGVQEVVAVPGKPKALERYNEYIVDNLSIYIQKTISGKKQLTLKLSGISFLKTISAKVQ